MAAKFSGTACLVVGEIIGGAAGSSGQNNPHTFTFWHRLDADNNTASINGRRYATSTSFAGINVFANGTDNGIVGPGAAATVLHAPVIGQWYRYAFRKNGTTLDFFVEGTLFDTLTRTVTADDASGQLFALGGDTVQTSNKSMGFFKMWSAALSDAEIAAERYAAPVRTSNLTHDYRFANGAITTDSSGSGFTLLDYNAPGAVTTFTADPPAGKSLLWRAPPAMQPMVVR